MTFFLSPKVNRQKDKLHIKLGKWWAPTIWQHMPVGFDLNMTPCRASKHWRTLSESFSHLCGKKHWVHATYSVHYPNNMLSKWAQLRGGLKLQDQSLALPPPASSVDFEDFTAQSSLGNTINFPHGMRGHPLCSHSPHSTPLGHVWANRTGRVFALLPKRIWVKTRFSRAKHQTSVRRCANREVVGAAGGHVRIYFFATNASLNSSY